MKLSYLLLGFLFYVLYKLIFNIVLPIYRTAKHVRGQFASMHQHVHAKANQGHTHPQPHVQPKPAQQGTTQSTDYIEYEEVK